MRFSKHFLDEIRQRLPVSHVVSKRVKLKRQGREHIGLSPFKVEKTPSFTVNDQKGFYHCFATGEHGDIFTFLMKMEGLSFTEAVERLAAEAGIALPAQTPEMQRNVDERGRLYEVMEAAAHFFEQHLYASSGRNALNYVENRGLSEQIISRFRVGYAPEGKSVLKSFLQERGFTIPEMIEAGLLIGGNDIPVPYDRFRDRVIFPITDFKDRVIAFGGRALSDNQPAKYLNSPETPLFHKGHVLFNAQKARQSAYDKKEIIVAEGYMDVIALTIAGFDNAVAPLGTALTENQIQLLWRMADEPVLCFDGDVAGLKAAHRAVETALPNLTPGKSIRFAYLPEGNDPDDLLRSQGPGAMRNVIDQARPLFDVLWKKEVDSSQTDTPEKRALLEQRVNELIALIKHDVVRTKYMKEARQSLYQIERSTLRALNSGGGARRHNGQIDWHTRQRALNNPSKRGQNFLNKLMASDELISSQLLSSDTPSMSSREPLILKTLINHLWLLEDYVEEVSELKFENKMLEKVRDCVLEAYNVKKTLDIKDINTHLSRLGFEKAISYIEQTITHKCHAFAQPEATPTDVELGWKQLLVIHRKSLDLKTDLETAEQAYYQDTSEENWNRLNSLRSELHDMEGLEAGFNVQETPKVAS